MKINKEIQRYQESILFGLSLRQMVFALLAIGVAVGAYFGLKPLIGAAEVGWVCMLAAFPFAMCGFFTYNGMPAERFLLAVIRSEILCPRTLSYHPQNLYAELLLDTAAEVIYQRADAEKEHMGLTSWRGEHIHGILTI